MVDKVKKILDKYEPISLEEMDGTKLMNRTDTKFVFAANKLPHFLEEASKHYKVLEVCDKRILEYQTTYFDTKNHDMYTAHHNTKLNRYKIRHRVYVDSDTSYLEVKFKNNKARTIKNRVRQEGVDMKFCDKNKTFLKEYTPYTHNDLNPKLLNEFLRLALVHKFKKERVTIDMRLKYTASNKKEDLRYVAIAEVKQEKQSVSSEFIKLLRKEKIHPTGMSKYCIGMVLTNNSIKKNRFKAKLLTLNKLGNEK